MAPHEAVHNIVFHGNDKIIKEDVSDKSIPRYLLIMNILMNDTAKTPCLSHQQQTFKASKREKKEKKKKKPTHFFLL